MSKVLFASFLFHSPKITMLSDHVQCTVEVLESSQLLYVLRRKLPRNCVKNVAIISTALVSLRWIHLYILHHAKDNGDPSESKCKWFQVLPNAPVKSYAPASDSVLIVSYPVFSLQPGICTLKPNAWGKDLWIVNVLELHIDQLAHAGKAFKCVLFLCRHTFPQILTFQLNLKSECRISTQTAKLSANAQWKEHWAQCNQRFHKSFSRTGVQLGVSSWDQIDCILKVRKPFKNI